MQLDKIVVATGNKHKLEEIAAMFPGVEVVSASSVGYTGDPEETGATFAENAIIKAESAAKQLGIAALADDSGLCVDALCGEPGIYSARYSGVHGDDRANRVKLLSRLSGVQKENRKAHFSCAVALCYYEGGLLRTVVAEGKTHGEILEAEEGENGFGYDSLFYSDDLKKSFGTASASEKNAVSHRRRALTKLTELLAEL